MRAGFLALRSLPAVSLLSLGCSSSPPPRIEPTPISALPPATATLAAPSRAMIGANPASTEPSALGSSNAMGRHPMPASTNGEPFALASARVGEPCGAAEPAVRIECGRKNRVGYAETREVAHRTGSLLPKTGTRFGSKQTPNSVPMKTFSVAVTPNRVLVEEPCIICRIATTDYRVASLEDATDEQLVKLQESLGITKQPAMRTEAAWSKALLAVADRI